MTELQMKLLIEARRAASTGRGARLRELSGLSQAEVAAMVGVTPAAVSRWEAGERRPTGEQALAYGRALRQIAAEVASNG